MIGKKSSRPLARTALRLAPLVVLFVAAIAVFCVNSVQAEQAYGRQWGRNYTTQDWNRLYHYPYVYYPQNFWGQDYYRSSEDMYYRYPQEMRIPVYNRQWHNYYPQHRQNMPYHQHQLHPKYNSGVKFHSGKHFILATF